MRVVLEELTEEIRRQQKNKSKLNYLKLHRSLNWGRSIIPHPYQGDEILFARITRTAKNSSTEESSATASIESKNVYFQSRL